MEPREKAGEIESGAHRVGGCRIEIISCNWLKCAINPIVNPIPVYGHLTRDSIIECNVKEFLVVSN
jgi:hypothetical protein